MKKQAKSFITVLLTLVVVISTSGFILYDHECHCTHSITTLIQFKDIDCCGVEEEIHSCCGDKHIKACDTHHDSCCKTTLKYYKITTPVDLPVYNHIQKIFQTFTKILSDIPGTFDHQISFPFILTNIDKLPFRSGHLFIIFIHQLKIAPPVTEL